MMANSVGVIVARFQVAQLHAGHQYLIQYVAERHKYVLIVLGSSGGLPTALNPLSFEMRQAMIREEFLSHSFSIIELRDHPVSNSAWSRELDTLIESAYPEHSAVLYGSRGSFVPLYTGKFPTEIVPPISDMSGTDQRAAVSITHSKEFRAGIIYSLTHRPPILYPTVDIAVFRRKGAEVLLMGRNREAGKLRFPGGFVDPSDESCEAAARRELGEEVPTIAVGPLVHVGSSTRISDGRYRGSSDGILTTLFAALHESGEPSASDDVDYAVWVETNDLRNPDFLVDAHKPLAALLLAKQPWLQWRK